MLGNQSDRSTAFDVRKLVKGAEGDNPTIQRTYDAINLMAFLIGDIPFRTLFTTSLSSLIPPLTPRLVQAEKMGLTQGAAMVEHLCTQLTDAGSGLTVADCFALARQDVPMAVGQALLNLRRQGIRIPVPASDRSGEAVRRAAVDGLVRDAGEFTFVRLFTTARADTSRVVLTAYQRSKEAGLLGWWSNDRCCGQGCNGGVADLCMYHAGTWCNIASPSSGLCSAGSDTCTSGC